MPKVMFINEGQVFPEVKKFVEELTRKWKLDVVEVQNVNVASKAKKVGDIIKVADLDERNREEVKRIGYTEKTFPFEPESLVGNHLMKTVAMNRYLEKHTFEAVTTGIRWDEQGARSEEGYFSPRGDEQTPDHMRVHPVLHLTERDIWDITIENNIPYCKLYKEGYRSLGAKGTTTKAGHKPAWEQDFDKVSERAGRQQDKEEIMQRLRDLGYM
jgi:phosphoadenosine phosphosulfate reductase